MLITPPEIEVYLDNLLAKRHPVFLEMEARAAREDFPAIGPQVGSLLELLVRSVGAKQVIDLGSGYGYSALWLAKAVAPQGRVILTEASEVNLCDAKRYFERAGLIASAEFRLGNAVDIFKQETGPFDIIFNDVDKEDYCEVITLAFERLRPGGLLITDNTLWYGEVVKADPDETTEAILRHNRILAEHEGFVTTQLPLRDGVSISLKL
ncbi:O-methyltransferase [bacterium]|nr:O-methyltransferase [bacterium]MBU1652092.1 O-methyltransferase [bacterium]